MLDPGAIAGHRVTTSTGKIELYMTLGYDKPLSLYEASVFSLVPINGNSLLGAGFSSTISADIRSKGSMWCISGVGTQWGSAAGEVRHILRVSDVTANTQIGEWALPGYVGCTGTSLSPTIFDQATSITTPTLFFQSGHTYNFGITSQLLGSTHEKGSLSVDFYDDGDGRAFDVGAIVVPVPPPVARIQDVSEWFPYNLAFGVPIRGEACSFDEITSGSITILTPYAYPAGSALPTPQGCASATPTVRFLQPGTYHTRIQASAGGSGSVTEYGTASVQLISASLVERFPSFEPNAEARDPIHIVISASETGGILGGSISQGDHMMTVEPKAAGDFVLEVVYHRSLAWAEAMVNGATLWKGPVEAIGDSWWEIAPLASLPSLDKP